MTRLNFKDNSEEHRIEVPASTAPKVPNEENKDRTIYHHLPVRKTSIYTIEKLNDKCNLNHDFRDSPVSGTWNYIKKYYKPTPAFFKRQLFKRIPFFDWIRNYNIKQWLLADIISGITIGVVHIPQGKNQ